MKDTFKFTVYSHAGLAYSVDIPQSCMQWKKVHENNRTYLVPDGLDETGQALKRNCMLKAEKIVRQHALDFQQYKMSAKNYFDNQRRRYARKDKSTLI